MLVVEPMPVVSRFAGNAPRVEDDEIRLAEARELLLRRADEHRVHEERVIGPRADDADLDAILRVPAREAVEAVEPLARVEVIERALAVDFEGVRVARDVHRSPPDVVLRVGMLDDALVLRRAAGLRAGVGDERAVLRDARVLLVADRVLVERARRKVVVDFGDGEAVGGEIEGCRIRHVYFWFTCISGRSLAQDARKDQTNYRPNVYARYS